MIIFEYKVRRKKYVDFFQNDKKFHYFWVSELQFQVFWGYSSQFGILDENLKEFLSQF